MTKVVPHDFWFRPDVGQDLQRFDLRSVLAKIGVLPGWNQADVAHVLDYSRPTMNKIVNGARPLHLDEAIRIVHVLGIPSFLVGLGENLEPGNAERSASTRQPAAVHVKGKHTSLWGRIHRTTEKFAALERERGGNSLANALAREVSLTSPLVREEGVPRTIAAFAELSALAGYAYYDLQRHRLAAHYYDVALQAAHESGDVRLVGQFRALMSMKATWLDQPNEGAAHAVAALQLHPRMPDILKSMLLSRQARAEALRGDRTRVHRLLEASSGIGADAPALRTPTAYWSRVEMFGNAGIAYKDVREFSLAEQNLRQAISLTTASDTCDAALYLGMLSRLYIKLNRLEEAADAASRILASPVSSNRTTRQLALFLAKTNHLDAAAMRNIRPKIRTALDATSKQRGH
ncbi:hypothetical protein [Myceligenerans salitolerans]|uniref:HTH cro/C1-type domain-containing protein n=1 Tax=Myceligenerans salitolerans TaxID=1230528 RepID=A0ABS3ID69_9MICO|nr:hypothetical protein [Myceligenerans salitolerans]MBO0610880.1 hypothetical protein [Myceligenerans salitolerans]